MSKKAALIAVGLSLFGACATPVFAQIDQKNGPLTSGNIAMNLEVGKTTQANVLEAFGAPNIVTMDGARNTVWSYQKHATVTQSNSSSSFWTIILTGGAKRADGFSSTQRTITLIIKFDANNVVSDFRSRTSDF
jgi:outer membrane protein assembly factor BamE (lipoprotein component of BamABCDE complex)